LTAEPEQQQLQQHDFLDEEDRADGLIVVRCRRCHAQAMRHPEEGKFTVQPVHAEACPFGI
jgi:hypothetical protein